MNTFEMIGTNMDFSLDFNNFDPENIQVEETINAVLVVDVSPSITDYESELNKAFNEFIQEMQNSHVADKLFVSTIEFCEKVNVVSGFQPITSLQHAKFEAQGRGTALYDAVEKGVFNAIDYRKSLEETGINTKTLVFIMTDGMDNSSSTNSDERVKNMLKDILKEERNAFSFTTIMFGIGKENELYFKEAKENMGIQHLATIDNSPKEIRKMIGFISSSISSSSNNQNVSTVNF